MRLLNILNKFQKRCWNNEEKLSMAVLHWYEDKFAYYKQLSFIHKLEIILFGRRCKTTIYHSNGTYKYIDYMYKHHMYVIYLKVNICRCK